MKMKKFLESIVVVLSMCLFLQLCSISLSYLSMYSSKVDHTQAITKLMTSNGSSKSEIESQLNQVYGDK